MIVQGAPEHLLEPRPNYRPQGHAARGPETVEAAAKPGQLDPTVGGGVTCWIDRIRWAEVACTGVVGGGRCYM